MKQENLLQQWAQRFYADADNDKMLRFRNHMQKQGLPDEPVKLLKGTVMVVNACCAYLSNEGLSLGDFLAMQTYHPMNNKFTIYTIFFNLFDKAYARIRTSKDFIGIDIADLHDHPWNEFEKCGFKELIISRTDGNALSKEEIDNIDKLIEDDLRYDFTEEEVGFGIDEYTVEGSLIVDVYDQEGRFS